MSTVDDALTFQMTLEQTYETSSLCHKLTIEHSPVFVKGELLPINAIFDNTNNNRFIRRHTAFTILYTNIDEVISLWMKFDRSLAIHLTLGQTVLTSW